MKDRLIEHRNKKQTKINPNEDKSTLNNTQDNENNTSHVKRLRLRGDWSDTGIFSFSKNILYSYEYSGPDSRPSNGEVEEESEPTTNQPDSSNEQPSSTTSARNLQNFFMQRMSDILTQLVTGPTSETEITATANTIETTETNINNTASSSTINSPVVQSPASSTNAQNSLVTTVNIDEEDDHESDVSLICKKNEFRLYLFVFSLLVFLILCLVEIKAIVQKMMMMIMRA